MTYTLFDHEELVIQRAEQQSADFAQQAQEVSRSLQELIEAYRISLREQQRLIRVSDLQQENLRQTTEALGKKTCQLEEQAVHLQNLNQQLEQEIENRKQLEQELQRMVTTDMLTGACSRVRFWEIGEYELLRRQRSHKPLAVLLLDIDHFKLINDRFGHAVGDETLRRFARISMDNLRTADSFGRLGGEEFGVILPDTTPATALKVAERLRATVAAEVVEGAFGQLQFTVSIGVAAALDREQFDQLIARADQTMYTAKNNGRNRVEFHSKTTD